MTKLFITIVIMLYTSFCFSQTSILGTYYIDYKLTDFSTNYTFYKNGIFEYQSDNCIGNDIHGRGEFKISNNYLILNYNKTKKRQAPYYRYYYYKNSTDTITVSFNVYSLEGNNLPLKYANIWIIGTEKGVITNYKGFAEIKLKKSNNFSEFNISLIGYTEVKLKIKNNLNYNVKVYLTTEGNGTPVYNQIDSLFIKKIKKDYFISLDKNKKEIVWKKKMADNN